MINANHPLIDAGFCGGHAQHVEITVEAVNMAIGIQGHEAAFRGAHSGVIADYFWFDTLQRPDR